MGILDRLRRRARRRNGDSLLGRRYSTTAGLPFDDRRLESSLTWIWGSPRSGSTWLLQLLTHPLDPDPVRPIGFNPRKDVPYGDRYDAFPFDETFLSNHLAPALGDPKRIDGTWNPGTLNNLMADRPAYAFSDAYEEQWQPEWRRLLLVRLWSVIQRARRRGVQFVDYPQVAIKETNGSHAADRMMRALPDSRMILLIRDGRDVVDSIMHAYRKGGFMATQIGREFEGEARADGLRWAAELWATNTDVTLRAIAQHPAELSRVVRYEDLLAEPVSELRSLFDWIGLERSDEWIAAMAEARSFAKIPASAKGPLARNRAAEPGLWRTNLSAAEQAELADVFGPLLERFGYGA
jgi:hypothetical protein